MGVGDLAEAAQALLNKGNIRVLTTLAAAPTYPRQLAQRLGEEETHVVRRLRELERARLVTSSWRRVEGKNVKLYTLPSSQYQLVIGTSGLQLIAQVASEPSPGRTEPARVPPRTRVFGREAELKALRDTRVRCFMVVGLAGMGKTSLATEFAHRIGPQRVFWHCFSPLDTAERFLALAGKWTAGAGSRATAEREPQPSDMAEALERTSESLSRRRAVVVLDDYQKVRHDGIHEIVRYWQKHLRSAKLLLLSRVRPPLDMDARTRLITLSGIRLEASRALLQSRGLAFSEDGLRRLHRTYGGHPLSLVLAPRPDGETAADPLPIADELKRLASEIRDDQTKTVLFTLVTVRRPLELTEIRSLSGVRDPSLSLVLLERRSLVRRTGDRYDIHDIVRETLVALSRSQGEIHRRALDMYFSSPHPEDKLEALHHAAQIGDLEIISRLLEADLLQPTDPLMYKGYVNAYIDVLDELPIDALNLRNRALVHYGRGIVLDLKARWTAAIREFEIARRLAEEAAEPRVLSLVLRELGDTMTGTERAFEAESVLRKALGIVESEGWLSQRAESLHRLHLYFDAIGDSVRAFEYCRLALRAARRTGNEALVFEITTICPRAWPRDLDAVRALLLRRVGSLRSRGEPRQVALAQMRLGEISCRQARLASKGKEAYAREAIGHLKRAITAFDTLDYVRWSLDARSWRALAYLLAGSVDKAESEAKSILASERKLGHQPSRILALLVLSGVRRSRKDLVGARNAADMAIRSARRLLPRSLGTALLERALIEDDTGGGAESRRMLERALLETLRGGYPDEIRRARREARRHRLDVA